VQERARKALTLFALDLRDDLEEKRAFEEIVAARALTPKTSGPIPKDNPLAPGAPPDPAILQSVADAAEGEMGDLTESERGVYLARLTRRTPSRLPEFDEVREKAKEALGKERARAAAKAAAEAFRARMDGEPPMRFEEAAAVSEVQPAPVQFTRTGSVGALGTAPEVIDAAFATTVGGVTGVLSAGGKFAILRIEERVPADESAFAQVEAEFRRQALERKQAARLEEWIAGVRKRAKLKSFTETRWPAAVPSGAALPDGR
jgi:peptidylprolyl isomerase/peptidyl-prolyl cis-trans isomerase D